MHFSVKPETEHRWFSGRMLAWFDSVDARFLSFFQPAGRTIFISEISTLRCTLRNPFRWFSGRMLSLRAAGVRFPADARFLSFFSQLAERFLSAKFPRCDAL
ncbi:hypothetical protein CEXT_44761 [Caerostris extrusa]|uniref:Uncharacterized protein n=1 Tax=Caerostris extrusa TaxID=172846 RepID=A0AAV4TQS0_CAEEX|nr:hypothetical protein CEXT_44761 [Caerostris extrusa]